MAVPSDERPTIHGDVVAATAGHMGDEHMLLSKRSSLKENGEWLFADGYNAAPYADISTGGVLGDEIDAFGQNMRVEHMMLPSSACRFNTNVQDDTLDTMAPDLLDGKVAEDFPCQNLAVLQAPGIANVQQAGRDDKGSCPYLFDKSQPHFSSNYKASFADVLKKGTDLPEWDTLVLIEPISDTDRSEALGRSSCVKEMSPSSASKITSKVESLRRQLMELKDNRSLALTPWLMPSSSKAAFTIDVTPTKHEHAGHAS